MQASLNSTAVMQYRPLQSLESKLLLRKLLETKEPMEYKGHLAMYARSSYIHSTSISFLSTISFQMSVIFRLAYGRRVRTLQDDIVVANIKAGGCECVS